MKKLTTILIFFNTFFVFGQKTLEKLQTIPYDHQKTMWIQKIEKPDFSEDILAKENLKPKYLHYDFSNIISPRVDFIGYIDTNYQKIEIYFTSVRKNEIDSALYDIKGISLVKDNRCDLSGTIRIDQIREYKTIKFGVDDRLKNAGLKAEGLAIGEYKFQEDSTQKHSGVFEGIMTMYWYVDKNNILHYDDIELRSSDLYFNNQYVGAWKEYGKMNSKICNWGEWRIPFSGDLDIGAAEFFPNPKYANKGWKDYQTY